MIRPLEETEAAWVSEYFSDEYLRLYQFPPERTNPEIAFLVTEFTKRLTPSERILDLACGQGRHAIGLAQHGFPVVGLDYQENLLRVASRTAQEHDVTLELVCGDMRQLPFADASFAGVMNMFTAFGYFSDDENLLVLQEVARVLRPGGWFIIDVANRDALIRQAQPRSWKRLPDGTIVISEWKWDVPTGRYTHWQLLVGEHGQREFHHSVRVYTCTELTGLLRRAGLTLETVYGGFHGEALTLDAPRMICIAHK